MSSAQIYEALTQEVFDLSRADLIDCLTHFTGDLRLDFSADYLRSCDDDRLRHLLMAALWRCRMKSLNAGCHS